MDKIQNLETQAVANPINFLLNSPSFRISPLCEKFITKYHLRMRRKSISANLHGWSKSFLKVLQVYVWSIGPYPFAFLIEMILIVLPIYGFKTDQVMWFAVKKSAGKKFWGDLVVWSLKLFKSVRINAVWAPFAAQDANKLNLFIENLALFFALLMFGSLWGLTVFDLFLSKCQWFNMNDITEVWNQIVPCCCIWSTFDICLR